MRLQRIRAELEAKLADVDSKREAAEKILPPYFDDWCKATVDEVVRVIKQTIEEVN